VVFFFIGESTRALFLSTRIWFVVEEKARAQRKREIKEDETQKDHTHKKKER